MTIVVDSASSSGRIETGQIFVDQNADTVQGVYIDKDVTNANNATAIALLVENASIVTNGSTYTKTKAAIKVNSAVTETSGTITDTANTVELVQTHADSTGSVLNIDSDGTAACAMLIDSETLSTGIIRIITPVYTTGGAILVDADTSLTTGYLMSLSSNSADTGTRTLVKVINDNTSAVNAINMLLQNDGAGDADAGAYFKFNNAPAANTNGAVTSFTTGGAINGFIKIDVNGTTKFIPYYTAPTS